MMTPGRELDALVAEMMMGFEPWPGKPGYFKAKFVPSGSEVMPCSPPSYSTDIAAAWEVVEKVRGAWDIKSMSQTWWVRLAVEISPYSDKFVEAEAPTAPHAICLAALKAVG